MCTNSLDWGQVLDKTKCIWKLKPPCADLVKPFFQHLLQQSAYEILIKSWWEGWVLVLHSIRTAVQDEWDRPSDTCNSWNNLWQTNVFPFLHLWSDLAPRPLIHSRFGLSIYLSGRLPQEPVATVTQWSVILLKHCQCSMQPKVQLLICPLSEICLKHSPACAQRSLFSAPYKASIQQYSWKSFCTDFPMRCRLFLFSYFSHP